MMVAGKDCLQYSITVNGQTIIVPKVDIPKGEGPCPTESFEAKLSSESLKMLSPWTDHLMSESDNKPDIKNDIHYQQTVKTFARKFRKGRRRKINRLSQKIINEAYFYGCFPINCSRGDDVKVEISYDYMKSYGYAQNKGE